MKKVKQQTLFLNLLFKKKVPSNQQYRKKLFGVKVLLPKSKLSRRRVPLFRNLPSISRASNRMAVTDLRFSCEAMVRCHGLEPRNSSTRPSWDFPDPVFHTSSSAILWDFSRSLVLLSRSMILSLLTPSNRAIYTMKK